MRAALSITVALTLAAALVACGDDDDGYGGSSPTATLIPSGPSTASAPIPTVVGEPTVTASGIQIYDVVVGSGREAAVTDTVTVNYTGWLEDGTEFDSGSFTTPLANLIAGWQEGVPGMKEGGKRRLVIPPELAYGEQGFGTSIPGNATLTFDIELVSVP